MSLIAYVGFSVSVLGLFLGVMFGMVFAKRRSRKEVKKIQEQMIKDISLNEIKSEAQDDSKFWAMKREVENARKRKYQQGRTNESAVDGADTTIGREEQYSRDEGVDESRTSEMDSSSEYDATDAEIFELHRPSTL